MNPDEQALLLLTDGVVIGEDGNQVGKVGQVFVDPDTGRPTWVTVRTGWFGTRETFVPLDDAVLHGEQVRVPYDAAVIKAAPHHEVNGPLTEADEDELHAYYRIGSGDSGTPGATDGGSVVEVIRHEEKVHVGVERVAVRRARLRKFVVTQEQTVSVPVGRQQVRLVREPITDDNRAEVLAHQDSSASAVYQVVLYEDRVVVDKDTVPVERITVGTEVVTEQRQIAVAVHTEQVELEHDQPTAAGVQATG